MVSRIGLMQGQDRREGVKRHLESPPGEGTDERKLETQFSPFFSPLQDTVPPSPLLPTPLPPSQGRQFEWEDMHGVGGGGLRNYGSVPISHIEMPESRRGGEENPMVSLQKTSSPGLLVEHL